MGENNAMDPYSIENTINALPFKLNTTTLQKSVNDSIEFTKSRPSTKLNGETQSTHHMIFEMNEFYFDMIDKIRELRGLRDSIYVGNDADTETVISFSNSDKLDPRIKAELDNINKLDEGIVEQFKLWKIEQMDRKMVQNDLCDSLQHFDVAFDNRSEVFLDLCKLESEDDKKRVDITKKDSNLILATETSVNASKKDSKNNFIAQNIERVKNKTMTTTFSLTDEEKMKLESLLSDLDDDDEANDGKMSTKDVKNVDNEGKQNDFKGLGVGFNFEDDEISILDNLEAKLIELSETASSSSLNICRANTEKLFDEIEQDERDGKYWKHESRLKLIEQELLLLKLERTNEDLKKADLQKELDDLEIIDFVDEIEKRQAKLDELSQDDDSLIDEEEVVCVDDDKDDDDVDINEI